MSQGTEVVNLARTVYFRLIPHLRPAAAVFATTAVGATLLGPAGIIPGAAAGGVVMWADRVLQFFRMALLFVLDNPNLFTLLTMAITALTQYLQNPDQPLAIPPELMDHDQNN